MIATDDIFRALADPTRLRILLLLQRMELSVGELAKVLGQSQPRVSRHIRILLETRLIDRRKEGSWVFLSLGERTLAEPLFEMMARWTEAACVATPGARDDVARLVEIRAERIAAAELYFAEHAKDWDLIRSLYVAESEVEGAMKKAIGSEPVGRLVDIGTGTGRMLALFGKSAAETLGIDRSPEMLRLARARLSEAGLEAVELRQADMYRLPIDDGAADTVILHQVLRYAHQPAAAVAEAARLLAPGGRLLIVDFAPHDHEELREQAAHARLGFADEAVLRYMNDADLAGEVVDHLVGGALTVTLWIGRRSGARLKAVA